MFFIATTPYDEISVAFCVCVAVCICVHVCLSVCVCVFARQTEWKEDKDRTDKILIVQLDCFQEGKQENRIRASRSGVSKCGMERGGSKK